MKKIAFFGLPRSGTSWVSHIFNSHPDVALRFQPLFSYGHKGELSELSTSSDISRFFERILCTDDPYALMLTDSQKNYPVFNKSNFPTHIVFKETRYLNIIRNILESSHDVLVVGLVRNPLATLASWVRAPKEFSHEWVLEMEWRAAQSKNQGRVEEFFGFDKWKEVASNFLEFQNSYPDRFKLVKYSEINANPVLKTKDIFSFCGLSYPKETHDFIHRSRGHHDVDPYSIFRANASDSSWIEVLPASIVQEIIEEVSQTPLKAFLD